MKMTYIYGLLIVLLVAGLIAIRNNSVKEDALASSLYDGFAQCLADKGALFYGAFWCPHCREQKELFKNTKKLPYVECSTPDQKDQVQICKDEHIQSYPTWKFEDGTVVEGGMSLEALSEKTNCELPKV